ncbi:protease SohB [Paraglaciecola aquimarina]|uniref:Protease SohB n=1 Tax=Paraglaciecola aquimarina TaxID=1235557 RepID=A0ABU3SYT8_9ALTE|nr:protease SohB [Paraglaciecola aquimarina]MDU0355177.1 protease SohB [Paraglaciecola aquimarina]
MEFLYEYGLFIAKAITIVVAILLVVGGVISLASKQKQGKGNLEITSISDRLEDIANHARQLLLSKEQLKQFNKDKKKQAKVKHKEAKSSEQKQPKAQIFVIDFKGSMDAHEVDNLREEVTAVLSIAKPEDEVLVRLESGGGVVHGYGLAASQLQRIRDRNIKLTIAVDKVAASGGYMMACVADQVLAAKFAIIGSIGVIAQLPNFNKLLKKSNIEFEQHTAGEFKRTLTMFGENNDSGREKFREELEDVHQMFKGFVAEHRTGVNIDKVATGEYWYGSKAKELGLVDTIQTSDDYLLKLNETNKIFSVKYSIKKNLAEKFGIAASVALETALVKGWSKTQTLFK